jgi:hypothetical protein
MVTIEVLLVLWVFLSKLKTTSFLPAVIQGHRYLRTHGSTSTYYNSQQSRIDLLIRILSDCCFDVYKFS